MLSLLSTTGFYILILFNWKIKRKKKETSNTDKLLAAVNRSLMTGLHVLVGEVKFPLRETYLHVQFLKRCLFETLIFSK